MTTGTPLSDRNQRRADLFWTRVSELPDGFATTVLTMITKFGQPPPEYTTLTDLLHTIDDHLILEFGAPPTPDSDLCPQIVISANGHTDTFPTVFAIVDRAPRIVTDQWQILALRPGRGTIPHGIWHDGVPPDMTMTDIQFTATSDDKHLYVTLYVPHLSAHYADPDNPADASLVDAVMNGLDHALGEYAVGTDLIIAMDRFAHRPSHARPLTDLPAVYETFTADSARAPAQWPTP